MISKKRIASLFVILYTVFYYLWLFLFDGSSVYRVIVSDILQTIPPMIVFILLLSAVRKASKSDIFFWLYLCIGCGCYLISQLVWDYYEIILGIYNPAVAWYSALWGVSTLSYISAVIYKLNQKKDGNWRILLIDTLTVMCIAFSLTYVYIILPKLAGVHGIHIEDLLYMAYPAGNLSCLYVSVNLYLSLKENDPERKTLHLVSTAFLIMFLANTVYSRMAVAGNYHSGSLMDPLWSLYILLLGKASIEYLIISEEEAAGEPVSSPEPYYYRSISLLPITSVIVLFIFMLISRNTIVTVFSSLSVILITLRHAVIISHNNQLISKLEFLNVNLEKEVAKRTQELYEMAFYDQLTGLPNRRLFEINLKAALLNANNNNTSLAVMFLDLDRFKTINDTLGHSFGDILLKEVADRIKCCLKNNCILSRQGGDEFAIIIENFPDRRAVESLARSILSELIRPMELNSYYTYTSCSIGIAMHTQKDSDSETLMRHADAAMYRSKEMGKNTYQFYNSDMDKSISRKLTLERELRRAIECNEFILHYQPQIDIADGRIVGAEALIRWQHPTQGIIFPADFIPIAEETGMIDIIGQWVLKTAFSQAKKWHSQGFSHLKMGVNISPYQLQQDNIVKIIKQIMAETDLTPECIELEITESASIRNISDNIDKLRKLQELGVNISIDDFGTGFSSLSYLIDLPISTLKIAQQFVSHVKEDSGNKAIISAIIAIARNLKLNIIAEGVENKYQSEFLKNQGCSRMQGYLFSKPVPSSDFEKLLKNKEPF